MRGPAQLATYLAGVFVAAGFVTIYFAWNGAAELNHLAGQFPYLVSGGLAGLALVSAGCALWIIQTSRQLSAERARRMNQLDATMASVVEAVAAPEAPVADPEPPRAAPSAPAPAQPPSAPAETRASDEDDEDIVVVGRSSYHDQSCHLVTARDDLQRVPRAAAVADGLSPCRVCKPA
jgi:hypothetical protein